MERIKYIPGDWVYIPKFGNYYTIISCGTYSYEARDENDNDVVIEEADIVPIPLTPEILKKNGWQEGYGIYYYEDITVVYIDNYYWIVGLKEIADVLHIDYVHQLQHFLFGLDLNSDMKL